MSELSAPSRGSDGDPPRAGLRRVPVQARGARRVDALLDAAASVIAEIGVDAATTNAIASRAGAAKGSLYQFFPNKEALVDALAARFAAELRAIHEATIRTEWAELPLNDLIDRVIDPLVDFRRRNPAFRHVHHASSTADGPSRWARELRDVVIDQVEALLLARRAFPTQAECRLRASVAVAMAHALLAAAEYEHDDRIVSETKRALRRYLADPT